LKEKNKNVLESVDVQSLNMIMHITGKKDGLGKDNLLYMDYEGYNAGIEVGEEFGCIHFEVKEE